VALQELLKEYESQQQALDAQRRTETEASEKFIATLQVSHLSTGLGPHRHIMSVSLGRLSRQSRRARNLAASGPSRRRCR
jgi:hypothetical protein